MFFESKDLEMDLAQELEQEMEHATQGGMKFLESICIYLMIAFSSECSQRGGANSGSCASGYGVCCTCKYSTIFMKLVLCTQQMSGILLVSGKPPHQSSYGYAWYLLCHY